MSDSLRGKNIGDILSVKQSAEREKSILEAREQFERSLSEGFDTKEIILELVKQKKWQQVVSHLKEIDRNFTIQLKSPAFPKSHANHYNVMIDLCKKTITQIEQHQRLVRKKTSLIHIADSMNKKCADSQSQSITILQNNTLMIEKAIETLDKHLSNTLLRIIDIQSALGIAYGKLIKKDCAYEKFIQTRLQQISRSDAIELRSMLHRASERVSLDERVDLLRKIAIVIAKKFGFEITPPYIHKDKAQEALSHGDYQSAVTHLENAILESPTNRNLQIQLAESLMNLQRFKLAYTVLSRIIRPHKDDEDLFYEMIECAKRANLHDKVIEHLHDMLSWSADSSKVLLQIGSWYEDDCQYEKALHFYLQASKSNAYYVQSMDACSKLYESQSAYRNAAKCLETVLEIYPDNSKVNKRLLSIYQKMGDEERIKKIVDTKPGRPYIFHSVLLLWRDQYKWDSIIEKYECERSQFKSSEELNMVGESYLRTKKLDSAIEILNESISVDSRQSSAYQLLSSAYMQKGDFELANKQFEKINSASLDSAA